MSGCEAVTIDLDMCHVGLGTLDECGLMTLFGNRQSIYLTRGLGHNASQIVDASENRLYPAYFMTDLHIPPSLPLSGFALWEPVSIEIDVKRYGETILDSRYAAWREDGKAGHRITMSANSVFILDPALFRSQKRQVSAPRAGMVCNMEKITAPPPALQQAAKARARGCFGLDELPLMAPPYAYALESNRDNAPGHPLLFAKIPLLMECSEREMLKNVTRGRVSEEILQAVSLVNRRTFYYGNAFSGDHLTLFTRAGFRRCGESLWKDNPRLQYLYHLSFETELYHGTELLALAQSDKVIVHEIHNQALIQDTTRLFETVLNGAENGYGRHN